MDPPFFPSKELALKAISNFEATTSTRFSVFREDKDFGAIRAKDSQRIRFKDINSNKFSWANPINCDGTPFICGGNMQLDCQFGPDRHSAKKSRVEEQRTHAVEPEHLYLIKNKFLIQPSKKMGCPARILMREILVFPDYKIPIDSTQHRRKTTGEHLKSNIATAKAERRIYIQYPAENSHSKHVMGEDNEITQTMDKRISRVIKTHVLRGANDTEELSAHIDFYVRNILYADQEPPDQTNSRFYPSSKEIR